MMLGNANTSNRASMHGKELENSALFGKFPWQTQHISPVLSMLSASSQ
jgi:hypothetical protein